MMLRATTTTTAAASAKGARGAMLAPRAAAAAGPHRPVAAVGPANNKPHPAAAAPSPRRRSGAPAAAPIAQPPRAAPASSAAASAVVKIVIQGRRLPVTPAIRDYVEQKVAKAVAHFASDVRRVDVTLSARGGDTGTAGPRSQKVDVTIHTLRHGVVRVEDSEESLYASIDVVCDKVSRKLRKVKELAMAKGTWARGRAGARRADAEPGAGEAEDDDDESAGVTMSVDSIDETGDVSAAERAASTLSGPLPDSVARVKSISCAAMSVGDAAEAMEALGHGFYVFRDAKSGGVAVVYRRDSGGYGVLVPQ